MKKVTEDELKNINALREALIEIISTVGELHLNKLVLSKQLDVIDSNIKIQENKFSEFQEKERVLYQKLQETYGAGVVDMETGEITE
jgi:hypothetical protein